MATNNEKLIVGLAIGGALITTTCIATCVAVSVIAKNLDLPTLTWAPERLEDGAIYNPDSNSWIPMSTEHAPDGRYNPYAFWTGEELIIWGGSWERADFPVNDTVAAKGGGRYNPESNTWTPISNDGAPGPRDGVHVVWTGAEMIVWGGTETRTDNYKDSGARYDPKTDTWLSMSKEGVPSGRKDVIAQWTGTELLIWGGGARRGFKADGALYNPSADT